MNKIISNKRAKYLLNFKYTLLILILIKGFSAYAQSKDPKQKEKMLQYIGTWYSTDNITDTNLPEDPKIKMTVVAKLGIDNGLQVEVFEKVLQEWSTILVELINYDELTNQIVASGINKNGDCFYGKGFFFDDDKWLMQDTNVNGEPIMDVNFQFINSTEVLLNGTSPEGEKLWKVKYIKQNPKSKNIGIQLVSVRDLMLKDSKGTLQQLGRMGYSFIETFVYNDGKFYDFKPNEFKELVESQGLKFKGSMVFKDFIGNSKNSIMEWWNACVKAHKLAGVSYITTSNNEINKIKTLEDLKMFADYYNLIGKLCKENGIDFGIHNHVDEFNVIDGHIIYDYLLENTNPKYVFFESDLYWMKVAKVNPIDYFKKYPGRFLSWHVKDNEELGQSNETDFRSIFEYSELAGLKYNIAEVEKYNFPVIISVELAYHYLYDSNFVERYSENKKVD